MLDGSCDVRVIDGDHYSYITEKIEDTGNLVDMHFQYLTFA
jgi:hypothetical protein